MTISHRRSSEAVAKLVFDIAKLSHSHDEQVISKFLYNIPPTPYVNKSKGVFLYLQCCIFVTVFYFMSKPFYFWSVYVRGIYI